MEIEQSTRPEHPVGIKKLKAIVAARIFPVFIAMGLALEGINKKS